MTNTKYYRAADLYSRPAKGNRPARRGVLPIGATQFYKHLKSGRWPQPDSKIGSVRLWSDGLIRSTMNVDHSC